MNEEKKITAEKIEQSQQNMIDSLPDKYLQKFIKEKTVIFNRFKSFKQVIKSPNLIRQKAKELEFEVFKTLLTIYSEVTKTAIDYLNNTRQSILQQLRDFGGIKITAEEFKELEESFNNCNNYLMHTVDKDDGFPFDFLKDKELSYIIPYDQFLSKYDIQRIFNYVENKKYEKIIEEYREDLNEAILIKKQQKEQIKEMEKFINTNRDVYSETSIRSKREKTIAESFILNEDEILPKDDKSHLFFDSSDSSDK